MTEVYVGGVFSPNGREELWARLHYGEEDGPKFPGLAALDALTCLYGPNMPKPNEQGWVARPLASDVTIERATRLLSTIADVQIVSSVTRDELEAVVGADAIRGF